ncbi:MAG: hypothetical protein C4576_15500 [Desulfobacteraceae bacterium]|nr:MAG: hypothetical protein C4576_15500 [Desulfobacteraceae bacterium]
MGSLSHAFWLWVPVLLYKLIATVLRTIWKLNLWILQTVSGVPLYYCRPEFRIPAIFIGTIGVMASFMFLLFLLVIISGPANSMSHQGPSAHDLLILCIFAVVPLISCRLLIRRGSI